MRVLVCGGRKFNDRARVDHVLTHYHTNANRFTHLIHGAASGADRLAAEWAERNGVPATPYPADWERDGRAAGAMRNARMLAEGLPQIVIAFPGGRGTADMVRRAAHASVPILRIPPV